MGQIKAAYPLNIYKQRFVSLVVDEAFLMQNGSYKWTDQLNEAVGAQKINLSVSQLRIDEHKLSAFINEMISADKDDQQGLLKKYFGK